MIESHGSGLACQFICWTWQINLNTRITHMAFSPRINMWVMGWQSTRFKAIINWAQSIRMDSYYPTTNSRQRKWSKINLLGVHIANQLQHTRTYGLQNVGLHKYMHVIKHIVEPISDRPKTSSTSNLAYFWGLGISGWSKSLSLSQVLTKLGQVTSSPWIHEIGSPDEKGTTNILS